MHPHLRRLKAFVNHPATQFVCGLVLLISSGSDVIREIADTEHAFKLQSHHGVVVLGLSQILGNLPDLLEGLERFYRARDPQEERG